MTILITGVTGFIGTNLAKRLLREGHSVVGIDNFYCSDASKLELFENESNFHFIQHDITKDIPAHIFENISIDHICNLACPASPVQYLKDPIYTTKVSVFGILAMLDIAKKYNIPILQASTSEVYGDPLAHPQEEEYWGNVNPHGVRACYDEGKRIAESLCFDYKRQHNTKIKLIRIFNTYGPFMAHDDGRVVSNFITQALRNEALTVYGEGMQTRSFCYVDDLVEGIIRFIMLDDDKNTITGPINLGNPHEMTINELIQHIEVFIPNVKIVNKPLPENDPQKRKPNISKAKALLHWEPKISLSEGLEKTIAWFKKNVAMKNIQ